MAEPAGPQPVGTHPTVQDQVSWLYELHQHLWNQPQLEGGIFHTANLTLGHWTKLQQELNAKYPNRHCDSYRAEDDVSAIKLALMGEHAASVSQGNDLTTSNALPETVDAAMDSTVDREDDSDEDESADISHFLPATIKYLDLSALPRSSWPTRCQFPLLIRNEYDVMEELLIDNPKGRRGSVFLTGQPGIGMRLRFLVPFF